ncbi:MAG: diguanylate cyclase [Pseudomonadota bacterium]
MNNEKSKSTIRVLLVDDDEVDRIACKRALAQHPEYEFKIIEAETGGRGLELAHGMNPDCILLDYRLPDVNGVEFLAELSEQTDGIPYPVVMLTGTDSAEVAVVSLKHGARDYVVKDAEGHSLKWLPAIIIRTLQEQRALKERAEAMEKLRETEAKFRSLVEQIPAITYMASLEVPGQLIYISPQSVQLGFQPEEWLNDPQGLLKWVHPEDREYVVDEFAKTYEHYAPLRCEYRMVKRDGRERWFLDEANVVHDESGQPLFLQGVLVDITKEKEAEQELEYYRRRLEEVVASRTEQLEKQRELLKFANLNMDKELCERKRAERALRESEARFRLLLESAGEGIYGLDTEGHCTFVNKAVLETLGYAREEILGQDIHAMFHHSRADGTPFPAEECSIYDAFRTGKGCRSTVTLWREDGTFFPAEYSSYPMQVDGRITGAVLVFRDVTETQALTLKLKFQATHDPLTGLINRSEFERRANQALASARKEQYVHALCYFDLDNFKFVNDSCGHAAGDELLRALSGLLQSRMRQRDSLARLGGDEFGVLLERCTLAQAERIATELCDMAREFRFEWKNRTFSVSLSMGIVEINAASDDLPAILSDADTACYMAKEKGRNCAQVFTPKKSRSA